MASGSRLQRCSYISASARQDFVEWLVKQLGRANVYRLSATIALLIAAAATWLLIDTLRSKETERGLRPVIAWLWLVTFALIGATWGMLTVNNTELVHYPQYFPTGLLVMTLTGSAVETLAWVTLFAGID